MKQIPASGVCPPSFTVANSTFMVVLCHRSTLCPTDFTSTIRHTLQLRGVTMRPGIYPHGLCRTSHTSSPRKTAPAPRFVGVNLSRHRSSVQTSSVTFPSFRFERSTFTIIPHLAYVLFPRQIVITFRGIRKYSLFEREQNCLGGINDMIALMSTKLFESKFLGSTTALLHGEEFEFVSTPHIIA